MHDKLFPGGLAKHAFGRSPLNFLNNKGAFGMKIFQWVERFMFGISQAAVFVMMILTTADVIARYFFKHVIVGAYEFTEKYLMVMLVFLGMSYVMKTKGHIRVDILADKLPKRVMGSFESVFYLLGAALMFVIGYQAMLSTYEAFVKGFTSTGIIPWPTWLSVIWVPIGAYAFSIRLLLESVTVMLDLFKKGGQPLDEQT